MIATGRGWLLHSLDTLLNGVAGLEHCWLHSAEMEQLAEFGSEIRRRTWIAGRVAAKRLILSDLSCPVRGPREIEIRSRRSDRLGQSPVATFNDRSPSMALSISHTERVVAVAVSPEPGERVGIDVVDRDDAAEPHVQRWLTPREQDWIARRRVSAVEIWAAKEAAFKTLPVNVPFRPTRCVIAEGEGDRWTFAAAEAGAEFFGTVRVWRDCGVAVALAARSQT